MSDMAYLFERFQTWLVEPQPDIPDLPKMMTGIVGVGMSESRDETSLTVFGILPQPFMYAADSAWEELHERGVRYVMSGPFLAAVQGGDSIGNATGIAGTLGCVVADDDSGCDLILSCHHVLADLAGASLGDAVLHPAPPDPAAARIARYERSGPIAFGPSDVNKVDAAVARAEVSVSRAIQSIGTMTGAEYDPPFGTVVQKHGRTTAHTVGSIQYKNMSFRNAYYSGATVLIPVFEGQFGIVGDGNKPMFAELGDSGAVVVTTANEAVGMVIAVAAATDLTLVTPIGVVENELGVSLCL